MSQRDSILILYHIPIYVMEIHQTLSVRAIQQHCWITVYSISRLFLAEFQEV